MIGQETCNADGKCEYGTHPTCDDLNQCKDNVCTELGGGEGGCSNPPTICAATDCGTGQCIDYGLPNIGSWAGLGGGGCQYMCGATLERWLDIDMEYAVTPNVSSTINLISSGTQPDIVTRLGSSDSLESPINEGACYGQRIRGYLVPPVTGNYTFWIASNDQGKLFLSTDDNELNKVAICYVPEHTKAREWTKFTEQKSIDILLVADQSYYYEVSGILIHINQHIYHFPTLNGTGCATYNINPLSMQNISLSGCYEGSNWKWR